MGFPLHIVKFMGFTSVFTEHKHKHYNDEEPDRSEDMELCKIDAFVDVFVEQDGNANESVRDDNNDENEVAVDDDIEVEVFAKESKNYSGAKTPQTISHALLEELGIHGCVLGFGLQGEMNVSCLKFKSPMKVLTIVAKIGVVAINIVVDVSVVATCTINQNSGGHDGKAEIEL
ncbi:hypothetical protein VNO78_20140 [Psophocarpus tetragonolobus]|uniref:Uncharacterized protein n=1 Tax=Psophocarpus tetragonolobus TaxID=3891 RepID=A0AAN9S9D2_PSOTE